MSVVGPRRLKDLLDAVVAVSSNLDLAETLRHITQLAVELVGARYGALGVLDASGDRLAEFITVGVDDDTHHAIGHLPEGHGILGLLIFDAKPLRLPDLGDHAESHGFPPNHPPMHSFLGVPIRVRDQVFGNLYLTEKRTEEVFTDVDEELVVGLAAAAGVAIENARLHEQVAQLAMSEDRERIARDLHDRVIQRLFATGLSLQGTTSLVLREPTAAIDRINAAIDELDETVKTIRTAIFSLEAGRRVEEGTRDRALSICRHAAGPLGFEPRVTFEGPIDSTVGAAIDADVVATLQEALSNIARHAEASVVDVSLVVRSDHLTLTVSDDGLGIPEHVRTDGHGLENMRARAEGQGGTFGLVRRPAGGTELTWSVSLLVGTPN